MQYKNIEDRIKLSDKECITLVEAVGKAIGKEIDIAFKTIGHTEDRGPGIHKETLVQRMGLVCTYSNVRVTCFENQNWKIELKISENPEAQWLLIYEKATTGEAVHYMLQKDVDDEAVNLVNQVIANRGVYVIDETKVYWDDCFFVADNGERFSFSKDMKQLGIQSTDGTTITYDGDVVEELIKSPKPGVYQHDLRTDALDPAANPQTPVPGYMAGPQTILPPKFGPGLTGNAHQYVDISTWRKRRQKKKKQEEAEKDRVVLDAYGNRIGVTAYVELPTGELYEVLVRDDKQLKTENGKNLKSLIQEREEKQAKADLIITKDHISDDLLETLIDDMRTTHGPLAWDCCDKKEVIAEAHRVIQVRWDYFTKLVKEAEAKEKSLNQERQRIFQDKLESKGCVLETDEDGDVNWFAFSDGICNGPKCVKCEAVFCNHGKEADYVSPCRSYKKIDPPIKTYSALVDFIQTKARPLMLEDTNSIFCVDEEKGSMVISFVGYDIHSDEDREIWTLVKTNDGVDRHSNYILPICPDHPILMRSHLNACVSHAIKLVNDNHVDCINS